MKNSKSSALLKSANVGIITALHEEYAAVCAVFGCNTEIDVLGKRAGRKYSVATVKTKAGGEHVVAIARLSDMGNNSAAIRATQMAHHCPKVDHFIMVGIAGAVPNPQKFQDHVRLGDIVVTDRIGIVQYDLDKEEPKITTHRHPPRPPGAALLEAVNSLRVGEKLNRRPWETSIKKAALSLGKEWKRPSASNDVLQDVPAPAAAIPHPKELKRAKPRVFHGPIASANKLLKKPTKRNALRKKFGVKAVEMEGSGIADSAWNLDKEYLVVRGTCDYCNPTKGDIWHNYAALIAAAYARCVVENLAPNNLAITTQQPKPNTDLKPKKPRAKDLKRERDVEQLKRLFYWLHLGVMDEFIDRLGYSCLTMVGTEFFDCFSEVVKSARFHISDTVLRARIETFFRAWEECFRYSHSMDLRSHGQEAHFSMPGDVRRSSRQMDECSHTGAQATPLRVALDSLLELVRDNYLEIDPNTSGREALQQYRDARKKNKSC